MKNKGLKTAALIIAVLVTVAIIIGCVLIFGGNKITVTRCIVTDGGTLYMIYDDRPIMLNYDGDMDAATGDKLLIVHSTAFAESYPEQCRATLVLKLESGTAADVPQKALDLLYSISDDLDGKGLDFRITQNVEGYDFSGHDEITGWFGARQYLGRGYRKTVDENGADTVPEKCVAYLVTAYPDYADGGAYVTEICITDPEVILYGLSVDSTFDEFDAVFEKMGFELSDGEGAIPTRVAKKGNFTYRLTQGDADSGSVPTLVVNAEVTNREGIVF